MSPKKVLKTLILWAEGFFLLAWFPKKCLSSLPRLHSFVSFSSKFDLSKFWLFGPIVCSFYLKAFLYAIFGMLWSGVHEQRIAARINGRTEIARIFSGEMDVIVISDVADDLSAKQTAAPFVQRINLLKQLRYSPSFQFCKQLWWDCRYFLLFPFEVLKNLKWSQNV